MIMLSLRMGVGAVAFVMMMALTAMAAETDPAAAFPYRYTAFDINVAWTIVKTDSALDVRGLIKNLRYGQLEDLDISVSLLDKEKKSLAVGGALPIPIVLKPDDYVSFSAPLKGAVLRPGAMLQFVIRYRVHEGADEDYGWMTSFLADAASGEVLDLRPKPSTSW